VLPIEVVVSDVSAITSTPQAQQASAGGLRSLGPQAFLQLLVSEVSNQDPLNPISSSDLLSQTAELSTLEQVASLAQVAAEELSASQAQEAVSLIGKQVSGQTTSGEAFSGTVSGVSLDSNGASLDVGGTQVPVSSITQVS
jgi:flagellar basal-body rod modification protein FlgD